MSERSLLVRGLIALLRLLLRLLILLFTGQWVELRMESREAAAPKQRRPLFEGGDSVPASAPAGRGAERARLLAELEVQKARVPAHARERLAWLERLGTELRAPLEHHARLHGIGLRRRRVIVLVEVDPAFVWELEQHTPVWPVALPMEASSSFEADAYLARSVGRSLALDVPGWLSLLRRQHGLPPRFGLPFQASGYDLPTIYGVFGPWLPELLAECIAAAQLGPGYAELLRRELERTTTEQALTATSAGGGTLLSDEPPLAVRWMVVVHTLHALGQAEAAQALNSAGHQRLGPSPALLLPFVNGGHEAWDFDDWSTELEVLVEELLGSPSPALANLSLLEVPQLSYGPAQDLEAEARARALLEERPVQASARDLERAALLALSMVGVTESRVMRALERVLRGATSASRRAPKQPQRAASSAPASTLAAAFRSPRALREAIVVGAAFTRPRHGSYAPKRRG